MPVELLALDLYCFLTSGITEKSDVRSVLQLLTLKMQAMAWESQS